MPQMQVCQTIVLLFWHYPMFTYLFVLDTRSPSLSEARENMGYFSDKMSKR